jgi:hypothetical protein
MKLLEIICVDLNTTDQLLVRYWRKMGVQWDSTTSIYRLQKSLFSDTREALYNILTEFSIPMELVMLIKTCLN